MECTKVSIEGYVSMDEADVSTIENEEKSSGIKELSRLIAEMSLRLEKLESQLSNSKSKESSATLVAKREKKKDKTPLTDQYVLFSSGEVNPKGGVYTHSHLADIYLVDEKTIGLITDETRCYFRIRVRVETYSSGTDGRLKRKHLIKPRQESQLTLYQTQS